MVIVYGSFAVTAEDVAGFDRWYRSCMDVARSEHGCVAYECLLDPAHPDRRYNVEVWDTVDDFQAHLRHPAHVQMMAAGSEQWGIRDVRMHFWMDAHGHQFIVRDRLEEPVEGRADLYERIAELQHGARAQHESSGR